MFEGNIEDVSKNILQIRNKLKEAYDCRQKNADCLPRYSSVFTPYNEYKYIKLEIDHYENNFEFNIKIYRDENDEEYSKRIEESIQRSKKAKLASIKRKETIKKEENLY